MKEFEKIIIIQISKIESRTTFFQIETKDSNADEEDPWVTCVAEDVVTPAKKWNAYNVFKCTNENTKAKRIKISALNPTKSRSQGLILPEVKVFGADE